MHRLYQRTIGKAAGTTGLGLHSGAKVRLTLKPAPAGSGITFVRTDLTPEVEIPASAENVVDTSLATTLGVDFGGKQVRVGTVEHLMSALAGLGIDNVRVEVDGPEVPIMDGSAAPFVFMLSGAGVTQQRALKRFMIVRRPVEVGDGDKVARLTPARGFGITCTIDFAHPLIRKQKYRFDFSDRAYHREVSRARTFGFLKDVEALKAAGLAKGGSLDNAIVVDEFNILNNDGLRFADEFVRHKVLDSIGDMALVGMPIIGHLTQHKSGHALNHELITELLANAANYEVVEVREEEELGRLDVRIPAFGLAEAV